MTGTENEGAACVYDEGGHMGLGNVEPVVSVIIPAYHCERYQIGRASCRERVFITV